MSKGTVDVRARRTDGHPLALAIERFQCPGCSWGHNTGCGKYKPKAQTNESGACEAHAPGTFVLPGGPLYLGLPRGFNKAGALPADWHNIQWAPLLLAAEEYHAGNRKVRS